MMRAVPLLAAAFVAGSAVSHAQSPTTPAFEVASIRPNTSGTVVLPDGRVASGTNIATYNGRFTSQNSSVRTLVHLAYGIQEFQVTGGPQWMITERFNVDAKAEAAVNEPTVMLMLQSLLTDRFQLAIHRETKEMPAQVLTVATRGPKIAKQVAADQSRNHIRVVLLGVNEDKTQRLRLQGQGSFADLARVLSTAQRTPVVDDTHVNDIFDIAVEWNSDGFAIRMKGSERAALVGAPPDFPAIDPELNGALERVLGIKLVSRKAPVEILVIDRVERPSIN